MADDIIRGYVGKIVVVEIDQRARPKGIEYGEIYIGRVRDYDGSFIEIGPFVKANTGQKTDNTTTCPSIDDTIAKLEKEFSELMERAGNLPCGAPKVISKGAIASMTLSESEGHADEEDDIQGDS